MSETNHNKQPSKFTPPVNSVKVTAVRKCDGCGIALRKGYSRCDLCVYKL